MLVHRLRLWLPVLSAAMFACSAAVTAWAVLAPCQVKAPPAASTPAGKVAIALPDREQRASIEDFEPLFGRRFQRPLFDPPPVEAPPPVKKVIPLPPMKLVATMPEPDGGRAMFSDKNGKIIIRGVGDVIKDADTSAEVTQITADHVVLHHEGQDVTLKLSKE